MYGMLKNTWISGFWMCWREWKLCAPSLVLASLQCFQNDGSLSLRWCSNWQNHRWLRLAETVGVHLVHSCAQVGLPRANCPCPDGFWVSLRMETPQPTKQPVLLLSHSHSRRKSFPTLIQKLPYSHLCRFLWTCHLWRVLEEQDKTFSFTQFLHQLTCMCSLVCRLRALLMHVICDFPFSFPERGWTLQ